MDRVKICLLITYLFTFYLGFMVQWGEYLSSTGSMQPFVLYSLSGLAIAVFFVATIFNDPTAQDRRALVRYRQPDSDSRDPVDLAVNVTQDVGKRNPLNVELVQSPSMLAVERRIPQRQLLALQLADLIAQFRGALELQLLRRLFHFLLQLAQSAGSTRLGDIVRRLPPPSECRHNPRRRSSPAVSPAL